MSVLIIIFGIAAVALTVFHERRVKRVEAKNMELEAENANLRVALELAQRGEK